MKINRLVLDNFRSYNRLDIHFERDLTVIVGVNGVGKTSVLDGIAYAFGPLFQHLPNAKGKLLRRSDIRLQRDSYLAPAMRVWAELNFSKECEALPIPIGASSNWQISRRLSRDKSALSLEEFLKIWPMPGDATSKEIFEFADSLINAANANQAFLLPLIVYYGTGRAVIEQLIGRPNFQTQFNRFDSLSNALEPNSKFKHGLAWFHAKENEEARELKRLRQIDYTDPELDVVRQAIKAFFPSFKNPRTELRPLRFVVDQIEAEKKSVTLDLSQLSDGYRTTLAMVIDLACRMVEANPPSVCQKPLEAEAIILIDEIDLHLHPEWQQRILPDLRRTFPNAQFIVTTHSPQVLSAVEARCIRLLEKDGDSTNVSVPNFSLGAKSVQLLENILGVNARPQFLQIIQNLHEYRQLVDADKWDTPKALKLRKKLDEWGANKEPELARIDVDIRMRAFRRGRA